MKFAMADPADGYMIGAYSRSGIVVGEQRFHRSLIVLPRQIIPDWRPRSFEHLELSDFAQLLELAPDLVVLGTGQQQRFPSPLIHHSLVSAGIGLEVMNTPAACRTYNILVAEGRQVAAALVLEETASTGLSQ